MCCILADDRGHHTPSHGCAEPLSRWWQWGRRLPAPGGPNIGRMRRRRRRRRRRRMMMMLMMWQLRVVMADAPRIELPLIRTACLLARHGRMNAHALFALLRSGDVHGWKFPCYECDSWGLQFRRVARLHPQSVFSCVWWVPTEATRNALDEDRRHSVKKWLRFVARKGVPHDAGRRPFA